MAFTTQQAIPNKSTLTSQTQTEPFKYLQFHLDQMKAICYMSYSILSQSNLLRVIGTTLQAFIETGFCQTQTGLGEGNYLRGLMFHNGPLTLLIGCLARQRQ